MNHKINFDSRFQVVGIEPIKLMHASCLLAGLWEARVYNPDGSIDRMFSTPNGTVNEGIDRALSVQLGGGTQIVTWYMGIISTLNSLSSGDTAASHTGWTESSAYTEATRPTWTPSAVSGQSITNPNPVSFSINGSITINGAFLISDSTKGGSAGIIWATGQFSSGQALVSGQSLKITYTCTATGA